MIVLMFSCTYLSLTSRLPPIGNLRLPVFYTVLVKDGAIWSSGKLEARA